MLGARQRHRATVFAWRLIKASSALGFAGSAAACAVPPALRRRGQRLGPADEAVRAARARRSYLLGLASCVDGYSETREALAHRKRGLLSCISYLGAVLGIDVFPCAESQWRTTLPVGMLHVAGRQAASTSCLHCRRLLQVSGKMSPVILRSQLLQKLRAQRPMRSKEVRYR